MFTARLNLQQVKYPLDEQADWLNDPRNTRYSEQRHSAHNKISCAEYIQECSKFWGIKDVESGEWVGTAAAHIDDDNRIADLGILIHWAYAGKGYGTEAWGSLCDLLLDPGTGLRKVEAGCMAVNKQMRRLCEKTGMFYEGERKAHFLFEGNPVSLVMYGKWPGKQ